MPVYTDRGSGTPATTGTTWASVTNAVDGTPPANPATYATMTSTTTSAVATMEVSGFDFGTVLATATGLTSISVSLRHFENTVARFASVAVTVWDGATQIGGSNNATLATTARNDAFTYTPTLTQLRSATFKVRITITGAATTQSRVESIDHVDVAATYTVPTTGRPKVYLAGSFQSKPLMVWSGSAWNEKPVKVWTGSAWKTLT